MFDRNSVYKNATLTQNEISTVESYLDEDSLIDGFAESSAYEKLNDYFCDSNEMPYLVAKGRTGEPDIWILERLGQCS
jgi:hypothetical protein|tara:strand:+ start:342 stop:575 length:234 start_codon:yes stop_codon:yes gene_type:complete